MDEEKYNYYHFFCRIFFPQKERSDPLAKSLEKLGFQGFQPRAPKAPYTYYFRSEDEEDLLMESHLEAFVLEMHEKLIDGVEAIEECGGEISFGIGLHEYTSLNNVALHLSKKTVKALAELHADIDIDRYLYVDGDGDEEE